MTNRFAIFGGESYYARGGFLDLIGVEDSHKAAVTKADALLDAYRAGSREGLLAGNPFEWYQVVNLDTLVVVASRGKALGGEDYSSSPYHMEMHEGSLVPTRSLLEIDEDGDVIGRKNRP